MKGNRQSFEIKRWMRREKYKVIGFAAELGISHSQVSQTIWGYRNSRKVLRLLVQKGCPTKYLDLPNDLLKDLQEAA